MGNLETLLGLERVTKVVTKEDVINLTVKSALNNALCQSGKDEKFFKAESIHLAKKLEEDEQLRNIFHRDIKNEYENWLSEMSQEARVKLINAYSKLSEKTISQVWDNETMHITEEEELIINEGFDEESKVLDHKYTNKIKELMEIYTNLASKLELRNI